MEKGGGSIKIFRQKIFSHSAEKFCRGTFYCFINFKYRKMLGIKERRGASTVSAEKVLSHSSEYFIGQHFCAVFEKFSGSEKVSG